MSTKLTISNLYLDNGSFQAVLENILFVSGALLGRITDMNRQCSTHCPLLKQIIKTATDQIKRSAVYVIHENASTYNNGICTQ